MSTQDGQTLELIVGREYRIIKPVEAGSGLVLTRGNFRHVGTAYFRDHIACFARKGSVVEIHKLELKNLALVGLDEPHQLDVHGNVLPDPDADLPPRRPRSEATIVDRCAELAAALRASNPAADLTITLGWKGAER